MPNGLPLHSLALPWCMWESGPEEAARADGVGVEASDQMAVYAPYSSTEFNKSQKHRSKERKVRWILERPSAGGSPPTCGSPRVAGELDPTGTEMGEGR